MHLASITSCAMIQSSIRCLMFSHDLRDTRTPSQGIGHFCLTPIGMPSGIVCEGGCLPHIYLSSSTLTVIPYVLARRPRVRDFHCSFIASLPPQQTQPNAPTPRTVTPPFSFLPLHVHRQASIFSAPNLRFLSPSEHPPHPSTRFQLLS